MEYYSTIERNKVVPFAKMWMDLETIILSEVSQKNKYILMRINLEKWYRWIFLQSGNRDTDVENKYMNIKGEGRGGMS